MEDYKDKYSKYFNNMITSKDKLVVLCPFHDDHNPSMHIERSTGRYYCFSCRAKGNFITFEKVFNKDQSLDNGKKIKSKQFTKYSLEEYASEKLLDKDYLKEKFGLYNDKNRLVIPYFNEEGTHLYNKYRYGNKNFNSDKNIELSLYGLQNIKFIKECGYVILVEGESDVHTLTYCGYPVLGVPGANAFKEEWYKYIKDLAITIYKEPDDGGKNFAVFIYNLLIKNNHQKQMSLIGFHDEGIKDPSDLFVNSKEVEVFIKIFNEKMKGRWIMKEDNNKNFEALIGKYKIPSSFIVNNEGIWVKQDNGSNLICSTPIIITKITRDIYSGVEKVEISYWKNNNWHTGLYSKLEMFSGKNNILNEVGIDFVTKNSNRIADYMWQFININKPNIDTAISISQYGWHGENFAPYASGKLELDIPGDFGKMESAYRTHGNLDEWIKLVKPLLSNDILRTYANCAFAAPLLRIFKVRNFVFHNWFTSRSGKPAALKIAQSVWGNPNILITSFNATKVAIESLASINNDLPLCIDEREVAGKNNDEFNDNFVYTVSNGKGRTRGAKTGGIREFHEWMNITITTGESAMISSTSNNGVISRVIEIYKKPFEEEKIASEIHRNIANNYGVAGEKFITEFIKFKKDNLNKMLEIEKETRNKITNKKITKISSHIDIASLLIITDYLANKFIFGNPNMAESEEYGTRILRLLDTNDNPDMIDNGYHALISTFQSKMEMFHPNTKGQRLGHYKENDNRFYVYIQVFDEEARKIKFDPTTLKRGFAERGYIEHDKCTYTKQFRNGKDRARYICLIEPSYSDDKLKEELEWDDMCRIEHEARDSKKTSVTKIKC